MKVQINGVELISPAGKKLIQEQTKTADPMQFQAMLKGALDDVNRLQVEADQAVTALAEGEASDIHQVMVAAEKAKLSLQLTVQVRNKMVEAYQEISRMQL